MKEELGRGWGCALSNFGFFFMWTKHRVHSLWRVNVARRYPYVYETSTTRLPSSQVLALHNVTFCEGYMGYGIG